MMHGVTEMRMDRHGTTGGLYILGRWGAESGFTQVGTRRLWAGCGMLLEQ